MCKICSCDTVQDMVKMQRNDLMASDGEIARVVLELHRDLLSIENLQQLIIALRTGFVLPWSRKTAVELLKVADTRLGGAMGPAAASEWLATVPPPFAYDVLH